MFIAPSSHIPIFLNEDMPEENEKQLDPESELPHMPSNVGDLNKPFSEVMVLG